MYPATLWLPELYRWGLGFGTSILQAVINHILETFPDRSQWEGNKEISEHQSLTMCSFPVIKRKPEHEVCFINKTQSVQYSAINYTCTVVQLISGRFLSCITEAQGLSALPYSSSQTPFYCLLLWVLTISEKIIESHSQPVCLSPFQTKGKFFAHSRKERRAQMRPHRSHINLKLYRWFVYK